MPRFPLLMLAASLALSAQTAAAAVTAEQVISDLKAEGYGWIEVKRGPTQMKVEAVRGTEKLEFVIDRATGTVLDRETEIADAEDTARSGVSVRDRSRDFADDDRDDDDGISDDRDDDSADRDDDDHDDDHDDSRGRGRGGDDHGDDHDD